MSSELKWDFDSVFRVQKWFRESHFRMKHFYVFIMDLFEVVILLSFQRKNCILGVAQRDITMYRRKISFLFELPAKTNHHPRKLVNFCHQTQQQQ